MLYTESSLPVRALYVLSVMEFAKRKQDEYTNGASNMCTIITFWQLLGARARQKTDTSSSPMLQRRF